MNFRLSLAAISMAAAVVAGSTAMAALPAVGDSPMPSLAPMVKRVSPAVVNIATRGFIKERAAQRNPLMDDPFFRQFFDAPSDVKPRERQFQSAGSGVIVDAKNGYIVTNNHVIENASEITITLLDNRSFGAKVIGTDEGADIAVLQAKEPNLVAMPLGDSTKLEVGDFVVAIGNPFGLQHTVTAGIVSALGRSGISPDGYEDYIQTDASINLGNSGCALVNLRGELVGINSAILSSTGGNIGIGFAIPVYMVKGIMDQLIKYGQVRRGFLGVSLDNVRPEIAREYALNDSNGAFVAGVAADSSAERAGVKAGDIINSVNGAPVKNAAELRNAIGMLRVGDRIDLGLLREGKPLSITTVISERGKPEAVSAIEIHPSLVGAELVDAPQSGGVLVHSVREGSPAAAAGLKSYDVIVGVGHTSISNTQTFRAAAKGANVLVLNVRRGPLNVLIPIR
jgi:serine protease Do/serine protease DegQ